MGQREKVGSAMVVGMERGLFTFPNDRLASSGRGRDLSYRSDHCSTEFHPSPPLFSRRFERQIFSFEKLSFLADSKV